MTRVDGWDPLLQIAGGGVFETLDGVAVTSLVPRQGAGRLGGEDLTHLVAHTEPPHESLFVDADGPRTLRPSDAGVLDGTSRSASRDASR